MPESGGIRVKSRNQEDWSQSHRTFNPLSPDLIMRNVGQIMVGVFLCLLLIPSISKADQSNSDPNELICDEEGKDVLCSHFKSTLAGLLAQDLASQGGAYRESDYYTDVTHCQLNLEINPTTKVVSGTSAVTVTSLVDGLAIFTIDLRDNMTVDGVTGAVSSYSRVGHTIEIALDRPYDSGESFTVTIAYHGVPQNLGFSSFAWSSHGGAAIFATLSEPWFAHTWWPCKDCLDDKFIMDMWVTVPDWMVVTSNGLLMGTNTVAGGKKRYWWHESYPIATYLVSLTGTNYVHWTYSYEHDAGTMPVEMYAYPESESSVRSNTSSLVSQIETFSRDDVFGEYPFINEKYGIAQFQWSGGMENQTMTSQGVYSSWLNAHELAHQWWGDMITCATWHDVWLNEGFATYAEAVYAEKKPGGSYSSYLSRLQARRPYSYGGTVYVYDISNYGSLFDGTTVYNKAAWVLHMLRGVVGDETFFDILAGYRAAYEGDSATTDDFAAVAEGVYGDDLQWFFDEWVYGGGAPYYRFGWEQQQIGPQNWMRLYINQYQQTSYGYPIFKMPIDITITTVGGDVTNPVWNEQASQWYLLRADAPVTSVQFDKDTWILRGAAQLVSYIKGPAKIIDIKPFPNHNVYSPTGTGLTEIVIQFSEPVIYNNSNITVTGSISGQKTFAGTYSPANYKVTLTFAEALAAGESWTVTVADEILTQASGCAIDGELAASETTLPSGDGAAGGDAVFLFYLCPAVDLAEDGFIDFDDIVVMATQWLELPGAPSADINGDGIVNFADFAILSEYWQSGE